MELCGLELSDLPDGATPLEAFTVIKLLDNEGHVALAGRGTDNITRWEIVGMLTWALDTARADLVGDDSEHEDDE